MRNRNAFLYKLWKYGECLFCRRSQKANLCFRGSWRFFDFKYLLSLESIAPNYFLAFLIFILPSQLAYHAWPKWSYVLGIRIDYLSNSIYFTELLIIAIFFFLLFARKEFKRKTVNFIKSNKLFIFIICLFFGLNIITSINSIISFIFTIKLFISVLLFILIKEVNLKKNVTLYFYCLSASLIFFGLIAIIQFLKGASIGGIMYYFGERSFTTDSFGIALSHIFGQEKLRPYSTFSHPNSMAGYFLVALMININLYYKSLKKNDRDIIKKLTLFIVIGCGLVVILLSFSKSVYISLLVIPLISLFLGGKKLGSFLHLLITFIFAVSLFSLILVNKSNLKSFNSLSINIKERLYLIEDSAWIIKENSFFGTGLNTFIYSLSDFKSSGKLILQPVHNIYLLVFAESGFIGLFILYLLMSKFINKALNDKQITFIMIWSVVFMIAMMDHYWITIVQNRFILAFLGGLLFNKAYEYKK